ncbi:MAG: UDP-N-acetylmuramoyl-tripeptide--D-alanyl-D-alanine ligase [Eubacterium sp.]|nr:UDP-N-acetylmuramoyl-tripeptide--D-alanyl-D-alanine ligase [Eubacterium sp.]
MKELKLTDIIKSIGAQCDYSGDIEINGVSTDTRTIEKGNLFIAIIGDNFDGHDYIKTAEEKGAAAVICSKEVEANIPVLMVDDTLMAFGRLAEYYRKLLNIKVVAVTGSNGKTSTRDMIKTVLSTKYKVYSPVGNFNNFIGVPRSILKINSSHEIAVIEIGMNHLGEISYLTNIAKPDVALITNVGKAHIGNLGSQENILKAKLEILDGLNKDGLLILNGDDPLLSLADTGAFKKQFTGIENKNADIQAFDINSIDGKTEFSVKCGDETASGFIPVLGKYNVLNALEAMLCGLHFGVDLKTAFSALENFKAAKMRCEKEEIGGVTFIKDYYNASPDSARVALESLSSYARGGKTIALLGEMLELGEFSAKEHENLGKMCVKNEIDFAYFIGDDFKAFKKGMKKNSKSFQAEDKEKMIEDIKAFSDTLKAGDAVLVKGSRGMKMEEVFEAVKEHLTKE